MNATLINPLSPIMHIIGRNFLCSYIIRILLVFIIRYRLIIGSLLCSFITIYSTGCFIITQIPFWVVFTRAVWLMIYKFFPIRKAINKSLEKNEIHDIYSICILLTCLQKIYVSTNEWTIFIECRPCTNNFNFIIFDWWYFARLITPIIILWCIIISIMLLLV